MRWLTFAIALAGTTGMCNAFTLDVREVHEYFQSSAEGRSQIPFLDGGDPIHERLTDEALACGTKDSACERLAAVGIRADDIREGVRSNDFPAQYLDSDAVPWCKNRVLRITNDAHVGCILGSLLKASSNRQKFKDERWARARPFGMRGHFGDLQFLHAMAPEGQQAGMTYRRIRMWMEVAYRSSRGEFDLRSDIYETGVEGIKKHFMRGSRKVGDLFNYRFKKELVNGIALGQMLHIAQDSFAGCHVERNEAGRVKRFLSFTHQKSSKHSSYDQDPDKVKKALSGPLNPVMFARDLFELRAQNREWDDVAPLVRRYFEPVDESIEAVAGDHCE